MLLLEGESDVNSVEEDSEVRECSLRVGLLSESFFTGWGERELALKEGAVGWGGKRLTILTGYFGDWESKKGLCLEGWVVGSVQIHSGASDGAFIYIRLGCIQL